MTSVIDGSVQKASENSLNRNAHVNRTYMQQYKTWPESEQCITAALLQGMVGEEASLIDNVGEVGIATVEAGDLTHRVMDR